MTPARGREEGMGEMAATGGEPAARRGAGRRWVIAGAIGALILLVIAYVLAGALVASASVGKANEALHTAVAHSNTVADSLSQDPFKGIDFASSNPDMTAAGTALKSFEAKIEQLSAYTASDRTTLQRARSGLQTSLLTLAEQSTIADHQRRVDAALAALTKAQQAVDLFHSESAFLHPLFDTIAQLEAFTKTAQTQDFNTALQQLAATQASLQKCLDLSQTSAIPPQLPPVLKALQALLSDLKGLITAAQAQDPAGVQRFSAAADNDSKALTYDDQAATKYVEALYKPLSDAYDAQMKIAAGS